MMRAALYARVSTVDQQTLPMQIEALRAYCAQRKWDVVAEEREVGSGAKDRPKRELLMKAARRKEIDVVLVWKLDRWGRSVADLAVSLKELNELKVSFVSFTEALDLTTPTGRAMAGLLSVFSEFERDVIRERVLAGIDAARKRGTRIGRPVVPRGQVEKIREMRKAGKSVSAIAREIDVARSTVRVYLKDYTP